MSSAKKALGLYDSTIGRVLFYVTLFVVGALLILLARQVLHIAPYTDNAIIFVIMTVLIIGVIGLLWPRRTDLPVRVFASAVSIILALIALRLQFSAVAMQGWYLVVLLIALCAAQPLFYRTTKSRKGKFVKIVIVITIAVIFAFILSLPDLLLARLATESF